MPEDQVTAEDQIKVTPEMVEHARGEFTALARGVLDLMQAAGQNIRDLAVNYTYTNTLGQNIESYVTQMRANIANAYGNEIRGSFQIDPSRTAEQNQQGAEAHFESEVNRRLAEAIMLENLRQQHERTIGFAFADKHDLVEIPPKEPQMLALFNQNMQTELDRLLQDAKQNNTAVGGTTFAQLQEAIRDVGVNTDVLDADRQRQIDEVNAHNNRMVRFSEEIRTAKYELAETARALGLDDKFMQTARERFGEEAALAMNITWHDGFIESPEIQQMLRDQMNTVAGEIFTANPQQDGEEMDAYMDRLKGVMVERMAGNLDVSLEDEGVKERLLGLFDRYNMNMAILETDAVVLEEQAAEAAAGVAESATSASSAASETPANQPSTGKPEADPRIESLEKGLAQLVPGLNGLGNKEINLIVTKITVDLSAPRENPMPGEVDGVLDTQTFQSYQHVMQHLNYLVALKQAGMDAATNPPPKLSQSLEYVPENREVLEKILEEEANNQIKAQEKLKKDAPEDQKAAIQAEIDRLTKMRDEDLPKFLDDMESLHAEGKLTADNVYIPSGTDNTVQAPTITQAQIDADAREQKLKGLDNVIAVVESKLAPLVSKVEGMIPMGLGAGLVQAINVGDKDAEGHEIFGRSSQDAVAKLVMFINQARGIENANGVYDRSMREGMMRDILTKPELAMIRQELGIKQMDEATAADYFGRFSAGARPEDIEAHQQMLQRIEKSAQYGKSIDELNKIFNALDTLNENNLLDRDRAANTTMYNMYFQAGVNLLNQFDPSMTQWLADFFQNDEWGQMAAGLLASFGINVGILWGDDQTPVQEIAQNSVGQQFDRYYVGAQEQAGSSDFNTVMAEVRSKMLGDLEGADATFKLAINQIFDGQGEETIKAALEKALDAADAAGNQVAAREAFAQSIIQSGQQFQNGVSAEAVAALNQSLQGGQTPVAAATATAAAGGSGVNADAAVAGAVAGSVAGGSAAESSAQSSDLLADARGFINDLTNGRGFSAAFNEVANLLTGSILPAVQKFESSRLAQQPTEQSVDGGSPENPVENTESADVAALASDELEQLGQDLADAGGELLAQEAAAASAAPRDRSTLTGNFNTEAPITNETPANDSYALVTAGMGTDGPVPGSGFEERDPSIRATAGVGLG
ncbi:MAG: hypothetical protein GC137_08450 [Alphaproteobacteria bacterium]|nr:hypothetical protein [Alphaproteobacteria bacterium]